MTSNPISLWRRPRPKLYFPHLIGLNHLEATLWHNCVTVYKLIHPDLHHALVQYLLDIIVHSSSGSDEDDDHDNDYQRKKLHPKMFPGAHPVSLNKEDARRVFWKQEHMFAWKKDGERMIMFGIHLMVPQKYLPTPTTTTTKNIQTLVGFMTRNNNQIFFVPSNTLGTKEMIVPFVMDGEMCWNKSSLEMNYLVFELMLCNGYSLNHFGLSHREQVYKKMMEVGIVNHTDYKLKVYPETHFFWFQFEQLLERRRNTIHLYDYDGLIPTHSGKRCVIGNDENTYKIKDIHTLDVRFKRHPIKQQFLELWATESFNKEVKYTEQSIVATGFNLNDNYDDWDNKIYECEYNLSLRIFVVKKQRLDKSHANSIRVIEKTLYTIEHNLTVDDTVELWKQWKKEQELEQSASPPQPDYKLPILRTLMLLSDSNWRSENLSNQALIEEMKSPLLSWEVQEQTQRIQGRKEMLDIELSQQREYLEKQTNLDVFSEKFQAFVIDYLKNGDSVLFS